MTRMDSDRRSKWERPAVGAGAAELPIDYYQRDKVVIASFRNVGIAMYGAQATMQTVRTIGAMTADIVKTYPRLSFVSFILDNVPMPSDETRQSFVRVVEAGDPYLACLVYVMSGEGFWASATRSLLTNTAWVRQRRFLPRICATVQEAASWMAPMHSERTGVAITASELVDVLNACARTQALSAR